MKISVALIEPEHEVNVGHIARLMKNFGLRELLLVKPKFDLNKAKVFATHGKDLLEKAKQIRFNELKRFDLLIGTTAIPASSRLNLVRDSIDPEHLIRILANKNSNVCLVMGREATGLTNEELAKCDIVVRIDTPTQYTTLNISHALAILLYVVLNKNKSIKQQKRTATKKERKLVIDYALALAKTSGLRKYKTPLLEIALKRILGRSVLTSKEVMLMVSLFRSALLTMKRKTRSR
jgi:TrmH family RNA methyltransferase